MLQIFSLRDKGPHKHGIEDMSDKPSQDELLERARRSLLIAVRCCRSVLTQLRAIKERKAGRVEHGRLEELLTLDFADLVILIRDGNSRVTDVGYEKDYWSLLIKGTTSLGVSVHVWVRLAKQEDTPLLITDFQIPPP